MGRFLDDFMKLLWIGLAALICIKSIGVNGFFRGRKLPKEVCFNEPQLNLGCYKSSGSTKGLPLPTHPLDMTVKFVIYSPCEDVPFTMDAVAPINASQLLPISNGSKVVLIVHGFRGSIHKPFVIHTRRALSDLRDPNLHIVMVDWPRGAMGRKSGRKKRRKRRTLAYSLTRYDKGASNSRVVGALIARFLAHIKDHYNPVHIHCIGFSLGAHACGLAGKRYQFLSNRRHKLNRITGLDPAGPIFQHLKPENHLWYTDARFVDVIHTNTLLFGMIKPIGNVDFWPGTSGKYGEAQPGCWDMNHTKSLDFAADLLFPSSDRQRKRRSVSLYRRRTRGKLESKLRPRRGIKSYFTNQFKRRFICSHNRAWRYYLNSITGLCRYSISLSDGYSLSMGYFLDSSHLTEETKMSLKMDISEYFPNCKIRPDRRPERD